MSDMTGFFPWDHRESRSDR